MARLIDEPNDDPADALLAFEEQARIAERLTDWTPDALSVRAEIDATCRDLRKSND